MQYIIKDVDIFFANFLITIDNWDLYKFKH